MNLKRARCSCAVLFCLAATGIRTYLSSNLSPKAGTDSCWRPLQGNARRAASMAVCLARSCQYLRTTARCPGSRWTRTASSRTSFQNSSVLTPRLLRSRLWETATWPSCPTATAWTPTPSWICASALFLTFICIVKTGSLCVVSLLAP